MAKHQSSNWKEQLSTLSLFAKLMGNTFRAIHYFQLLSKELNIRQDIGEFFDFLTNFL